MDMEPQAKPRVAVVEDESDLRDNIVRFLDARGYPCWGAESAEVFYREVAVRSTDVVVLDLGLPGEDGLKVAEHLAAAHHYGIVIVSARGTLDDRLTGLSAGADAYLVKPVDLREIAASVDAVWRRFGEKRVTPAALSNHIAPHWRLHRTHWTLSTPAGNTLPLTPTEYRFIRCLAESAGEPVAKEHLMIALGGAPDSYDYHRIESLVSRLRKKAQTVTGCDLPIKAIQSYGFVFSDSCELV
jgi:DNA-binding response OmpR family regulator